MPHNKYTGCPELNGLVTPPDFYCPFGERKDAITMQGIRLLNQFPAADVEPVRHGKWIVSEDEYRICATEFTCSNCEESYCTSELTDEEFLKSTHYCPNCGAKMDEVVSE